MGRNFAVPAASPTIVLFLIRDRQDVVFSAGPQSNASPYPVQALLHPKKRAVTIHFKLATGTSLFATPARAYIKA